MAKLTRKLYEDGRIQDAIAKAKQRNLRDQDGDHYTVYYDPTLGRIWVVPQTDGRPTADAQAVFGTEEGEYLED